MSHFGFDTGIFDNAMDGLADICKHFQMDLSCLADGELDEAAAGRALLHLESCSGCKEFFDDTRRFARMHRDIGEPERLMARVAALTGSDALAEAESFDLVHRLATIFYQLGKAYTLTALDPAFRRRLVVFEKPVPVEDARNRGRGFVDGVVMGHRHEQAGSGSPAERVDWRHARHMLNGRLENIEDPLEKGLRLLEEAIAVDPSHEEAHLHLANAHKHQGRPIKALETYRNVFDIAVNPVNRGHAAVQLGRLYWDERNSEKALLFFRWLTITGLADEEPRFSFVRHNIGLVYAHTNRPERALDSFRKAIDKHPDRTGELVAFFQRCPELRSAIDIQPGFAESLVARCPELFEDPGAWNDSVGADSNGAESDA